MEICRGGTSGVAARVAASHHLPLLWRSTTTSPLQFPILFRPLRSQSRLLQSIHTTPSIYSVPIFRHSLGTNLGPPLEMGGKKFAVLLCEEDSDYVMKKYGGYFGVFVGLLGEEGETWAVYKAAQGEFPDDDEIDTFDGFVITGSCSDADSDDVWICKLLNLLKKLDSKKKKILGICFGHQILARAIGAKIGRAESGWDIGVTSIHFSSSSKLFSSPKMPLSIIQCHSDEVRELPPKAEVMAWSSKTGIEMFRLGDHIMGIQGHPEYTKDILLHLIDPLLQYGFIEDSDAVKIKANLDEQEPDREAWRNMCTDFLKSRL